MNATERAEGIIGDVEKHGERWAALAHREDELESRRPLAKVEAIRRIMGTDNPDTGKAHSASSAEKVVETDPEYFAFLQTQRDVTREKNEAWVWLEAARLRARLYVALAGGVA